MCFQNVDVAVSLRIVLGLLRGVWFWRRWLGFSLVSRAGRGWGKGGVGLKVFDKCCIGKGLSRDITSSTQFRLGSTSGSVGFQ